MEAFHLNPRQRTILELLRRQQAVAIPQLAQRFAVSEMTVRRDLQALEAQRLLIRTHGGGVSAGETRFLQLQMPHIPHSPTKAAIGQRAAALVQPGMTIMLDEGTTTLEVARHLPRDMKITVATMSLYVAQELFQSEIEVVVFGGVLRKEFPSMNGPLTEQMIQAFHVDLLFVGCDAADSRQGFYFQDTQLASLERAMMSIADRVVVVTESKKFQRTAFMRYATPAQINTLVTDAGISAADHEELVGHGVTVLLADLPAQAHMRDIIK